MKREVKARAVGTIPPRRTHRRAVRMCAEQDSAKWLEEASDRARRKAGRMRPRALPKRRTTLAWTLYQSISPQPCFSHAPKRCRGQDCDCQCRGREFNPWVRKMPWGRKWKPTPVFLPGEPHGQRSLVGYSFWVLHKESNMTQWLHKFSSWKCQLKYSSQFGKYSSPCSWNIWKSYIRQGFLLVFTFKLCLQLYHFFLPCVGLAITIFC